MGDFLVGLDNYISQENKNQKDFLEAMDKKIAPLKVFLSNLNLFYFFLLKEEKKRGRIEEIVIYSEQEKKQFINDYKNGIKNFYTYKGSGKEYLEKKLKLKKMEEI